MLNGILLLDKPEGFTSHDAVAKLRGMLRQKRIGHAGTLDPLATGLLVVLLGNATRASDQAAGQQKEYLARLRLGLETDTEDITGQTLAQRPVTAGREDLQAILPRFTGEILQRPPMYSALQVDGKRLYALARKGVAVELEGRPITVSRLSLLPPAEGLPAGDFDLQVVCSKGTYIRALCRDLGQALGCGGCMAALRRVRSGGFSLEDALTFAQIAAALEAGTLAEHILPTDRVYETLPAVRLNEAGDLRASHGAFFTEEHLSRGEIPPEGALCRVYDSGGVFRQAGQARPLEKGGLAIFCKTNFC